MAHGLRCVSGQHTRPRELACSAQLPAHSCEDIRAGEGMTLGSSVVLEATFNGRMEVGAELLLRQDAAKHRLPRT